MSASFCLAPLILVHTLCSLKQVVLKVMTAPYPKRHNKIKICLYKGNAETDRIEWHKRESMETIINKNLWTRNVSLWYQGKGTEKRLLGFSLVEKVKSQVRESLIDIETTEQSGTGKARRSNICFVYVKQLWRLLEDCCCLVLMPAFLSDYTFQLRKKKDIIRWISEGYVITFPLSAVLDHQIIIPVKIMLLNRFRLCSNWLHR